MTASQPAYVCTACHTPVADTSVVVCSNCGVDFRKVHPTPVNRAPPAAATSFSERYAGTTYGRPVLPDQPAVPSTMQAPAIGVATAGRRIGPLGIIGIALLVAAVAVGAILIANGGLTNALGGGVSGQNLPPTGQVWFGTAYDPQSFALTNRATSFPTGGPIAMVAHLSRTGAGRVTVYVQTYGIQAPLGYADMTGANDVMADLLQTSGLEAGDHAVTIKDQGGNVVASGDFTMH